VTRPGVVAQLPGFLLGLALGVLSSVAAFSAQLARVEERVAATDAKVGALQTDVRSLTLSAGGLRGP
jgi:hypothetical protein